ncbi:MAG TPA: hypothetical protein VEU30_08575, partial [Thermoanaerobaculia bacterium]|nr:hypothetical protein [Thermoanaerobaculia bacterium]
MKTKTYAAATAVLLTTLLTIPAAATTQLVLERGTPPDAGIAYTGVVDLAINPGFDNAKVTVLVDGQKIADNLLSPYHVVVDFGP